MFTEKNRNPPVILLFLPAFVNLFPQWVTGAIERATNLLHSLIKNVNLNTKRQPVE